MKNTLFVRPNLKLFLLAAVLIALVHHLIVSGHSQVSLVTVTGREPAACQARQSELRVLLQEARQRPSSEIFMRISHLYEQERQIKEAVNYLRRAQKMAEWEERFQ
jgi:hypothetical protein